MSVLTNIVVELDASGSAEITVEDVDAGTVDNCAIQSMELDKTAFSCADVGSQSVTFSVTDVNGNTANDIVFVTVEDNLAPVIYSDISLEVSGSYSLIGTDVAYDNCDFTVTFLAGQTNFDCGDIGNTYIVTVQADDVNGNTTTQDINITITDEITVSNPTLDDIVEECYVDLASYIPTGTTSDALTYSTQGTHVITWNFDDGNGNDIDVTQNVVIEDITAPTPDIVSLPELTGECSVDDPGTPTGTDNCGGMVTVTTGTTFPTGLDIVWTYEDESGNTYTQTQTVTVADISAPVPDITDLPDLTEECSIDLSTYSVTATDNCTGTIYGTPSQTIFDTQGTYSVTWTYEDLAGNTYLQTQTIIIEDLTSPETLPLDDITGVCSASVTYTPTATDNCTGVITGTTTDPLTYTEQGTYSITWTYDDGNGNIVTQTQNVIVLDDILPTVITQDIEVNLNGQASVTITPEQIDNGSTDNCGIEYLMLDVTVFTIEDLGTNSVTLTAIDYASNPNSATATVTVVDFVGIAELDNSLNIYPNPSNGLFNIETETLSEVTITDVTGRLIFATELTDTNTQIDLSSYGRGVYFINFIFGLPT